MENKYVGFLVIAIALFLVIIVFMFNRALISMGSASCIMGASCPMYNTLRFQTNLSIAIISFIVLLGLFLIFNKEKPREIIRIKRVKEPSIENIRLKEKEKNLKLLNSEERKIYQTIIDAEGTIFQSELVDKSGFDKVKVTRILDRLEGKQLIERKRRGMSNIVILK